MDNTKDRTVEEISAAKDYVTNNPDSEIRRMYGHHIRSFLAGVDYASLSRLRELGEERKLTELQEKIEDAMEREQFVSENHHPTGYYLGLKAALLLLLPSPPKEETK